MKVMYTVTYLLEDETYLLTTSESPFLPSVGDEISLTGLNLDGTFLLTRRIFNLHQGTQNTIHVTAYCRYRSRNASTHRKS